MSSPGGFHHSSLDWLPNFLSHRAASSSSSESHPYANERSRLVSSPERYRAPIDSTAARGIYGSEGSLSPTYRSRGFHTFDREREDCRPPTAKMAFDEKKDSRLAYLSYYIPFLNWVTQYRLSYFKGDLISALTMASIYIPIALSLASNVARGPAIIGMYTFVFHPLVYAIFGSSTMMVVGPEAAGSLLVGSIVHDALEEFGGEEGSAAAAQIVGITAGVCGALTLVGGLTRLGYLDNILSRPFLRGFISAIGITILVDQLIPEVGLSEVAKLDEASHGSVWQKLGFIWANISNIHQLTMIVAFSSFLIIMLFKTGKRRLEPRYPWVVFVPDRFFVVIVSAFLSWYFEWDKRGLAILGPVGAEGTSLFQFRWPFRWSNLPIIKSAMSTSFLIAVLGFFESSVAAKGLGDGGDGVQSMGISANRELVALGMANIVGGCFMALPAFGGYARSKLNVSTGAKSPMSSILLSFITFLCILFVIPYLYCIPMAVLSSMISVVAFALVEEAPHDISFFIRIRGWSELSLMFVIFLSTMFFSLYLGIALGIGLSLLAIIKHSSKPRIQILGKVVNDRQGTSSFDNPDLHPENTQFIEGCLIVKIPEPLTFANTGDLKNRLRRLERYGDGTVHPSRPRVRAPEENQNIIFDIHGVTSIDGSGTQVLGEIVRAYLRQGVRVYFCHVPRSGSGVYEKLLLSGIVADCGGPTHFVSSVEEALDLAHVKVALDEP